MEQGNEKMLGQLEIFREDLRSSDTVQQILRYANFNKALDIKLVNMDFHSIVNVLGSLERLPNLRSLDLSHSNLTQKDFFALMNTFKHPTLTHLILRDNLIECHDELEWKKKFETQFPSLPNLERIDLSGNPIHNHNSGLVFKGRGCSREIYQEAVEVFLKLTGFTLGEFLRSKWMGVSLGDEGELKLRLSLDGHESVFNLTQNEYQSLDKVREGYQEVDVVYAYKIIQMAIQPICLASDGFNENTRYVDLSDNQKEKVKSMAFDFHPHAPLASMVRRHPLYHCESMVSCESLLFKDSISEEQGYVYYLAHNNGKHAAVAFECLTPDGQRVFEVAHLTAEIQGGVLGFYGRASMKIEYIKKDLNELPTFLLSNFKVAKFKASYLQCKALWESIDNEVVYGVSDAEYSKIVTSSSSGDETKDKVVINCVRWILSKIKEHLDIDLRKYARPLSYAPSGTLAALLKEMIYQPGVQQVFECGRTVGIEIRETTVNAAASFQRKPAASSSATGAGSCHGFFNPNHASVSSNNNLAANPVASGPYQPGDVHCILIQFFIDIQEMLIPSVSDLLSDVNFFNYLVKESFVSQNITHSQVLKNIEKFSSNLNVIKGFLDYELTRPSVKLENINPIIWDALSKVEKILDARVGASK